MQTERLRTNLKALYIESLSWLFSWEAIFRFDGAKGGVRKELGRIFKNHKSHTNPIFSQIIIAGILLLPAMLVTSIKYFPGRINIPINLFNRETLSTIISDLMLVPLSLVGLVIPFFAIVADVVLSKFGFGTIQYAFRRSGIKEVIYYALLLIVAEVTVLTFVRSLTSYFGHGFGSHPYGYMALTLSLAWATLIVIFLSVRAILGSLSTFNIEFALKLFQKKLIDAGIEEMRNEFAQNLSLLYLDNQLKGSNFSVSWLTPSSGKLVTANKIGMITDIGLRPLRRLEWLLKWLKVESYKITIASPSHFIEKRRLQVASITLPDDDTVHRIANRLVKSSVRIRRSDSKRDGDSLLDAHETYKGLVLTLVKQQNDALLMSALNGYSEFFKSYLDLGVQLPAEANPRILGDWRPITLVLQGLREIIELSISNPDGETIGTIAYWLKQEMERCIEQNDEYIFSRLLNEFRTISYFAQKNNNPVGLHRAHFEPLQIFDYSLFRFGETEDVTSKLVEYRVKLANLVIKHLFSLLKDALDVANKKRFVEIISKLKSHELFASFHPDLPFDKWESTALLRGATLPTEERVMHEDRVKSWEMLDAFKNEYGTFFKSNIHDAASYAIEKSHPDYDFSEDETSILKELWLHMGAFSDTADWIDKYDLRESVSGGLWDYIPETRGVFSKDPLFFPFCIFVSRGLQTQSTEAAPINLPAIRTIYDFIEKIKEITENIAGTPQWGRVIGAITQETKDKWLLAIEDAKSKYSQSVSKSIVDAVIEDSRISLFKKNYNEGYEESGVFKFLIAENRIEPPFIEVEKTIEKKGFPSKEAFITQTRIHFGEFGKEDGRSTANWVDEEVVKFLSSKAEGALSESTPKELKTALVQAISTLPTESTSLKAFILSDALDFHDAFYSMEGFLPPHRLDYGHRRGLFGEFNGVPIYHAHVKDIHGLLLADLSLLCLTDDKSEISVRECTSEELGLLVRDNEGFTNEKAKEWVRLIISGSFKLVTSQNLHVISIAPREQSDSTQVIQ